MHKHILLVTAIAGCTALTLSAQINRPTSPGVEVPTVGARDTIQTQATSTQADSTAKEFLKTAAKGNQEELVMVNTAMDKAQNQELKQFVMRLHQDHQMAHQQLQSLLQKHNVETPPTNQISTSTEAGRFKEMPAGQKWDKEFAEAALKDHVKDIKTYHQATQNIQAQDVKQFAQTQLPKLQQHFEQAKKVARTLGVDQSTISQYDNQIPAAVGGTGDDQQQQQGSSQSGSSQGSSSSVSPGSSSGTSSSTNQDTTQP